MRLGWARKTALDLANKIGYSGFVHCGQKNISVVSWLWLVCLLCLLGGWDLGAKVPSSCLGGKTLPPGCAWNLNRRTNNGTATSFTVDSLSQLTAGPTSPYTNDNNGNLTGQVNYYAYGYSYDDEDQLTSVIFSGISKSDFKYDGLGRLRQRQEYTWSGGWYLSATVNYVYDGRRVIQERDGNNTPTVSYTRGLDLGGGLEGAGGIGGLLARSHGYNGGSWSTHNYYHVDGGGNITCLMNSSQAMAATYRYDPFGKLLAQSGTLASANVYRFSSKEFHSASGLFYYGFRFYDPNLQRWLNRDPIGEEGGINLYGFVFNNPASFTDPLGLAFGNPISGPSGPVGPSSLFSVGMPYYPNGVFYVPPLPKPPCPATRFVGGVVFGAIAAGVVVFAAPIAVTTGASILTAAGLSAGSATTISCGAVTFGLYAAGGYGAYQTVAATAQSAGFATATGDWGKFAFNAGSLIGGTLVGGGGGGRALADGIMGQPSPAPNTWNLLTILDYEIANAYKFSLGPPGINYWATAPTPFSGGFTAGSIASGVGTFLQPSAPRK